MSDIEMIGVLGAWRLAARTGFRGVNSAQLEIEALKCYTADGSLFKYELSQDKLRAVRSRYEGDQVFVRIRVDFHVITAENAD